MTPPFSLPTATLVLACLLPSAITWLYFVALDRHESQWQQMAYMIGKTIQFALPVWALRGHIIWPRPLRWSNGVGIGLAFAFVAAAAMTGLYAIVLRPSPEFGPVQQQIIQKLQGLDLSSPITYVAVAVFYSLIHSALEEYYWRWFVYGQLRTAITPVQAALLSSLSFMAHHVILLATYFGWTSGWTYLTSLGVACGGLAWAWIYERTGNLLATWVSHLVIDATIFAIGYHVVWHLFAAT